MLLQQLGEHLVFALEFLLQSFNLLLIPIRNSGAGLFAFKSGCPVLEKLSLPLVKHRRVDVVLVAQIRNGFALAQESFGGGVVEIGDFGWINAKFPLEVVDVN